MLNHEEEFIAGPSGLTTTWANKRYSKCPIIIESFFLQPGKTSNHHPQATCKYCEKVIVCGAKERLISHLKHCKKTTERVKTIILDNNFMTDRSNKNKSNHSKKSSTNARPKNASNSSSRSRASNSCNSSTQRKKGPQRQAQRTQIDRLYLRLIALRGLPLNLCDTPEFRQFVSLMSDSEYELPTSATFVTKVLKREASQVRRQMIEIIGNLPKRSINLEFDSWLDARGRVVYVFVMNVELNGKSRRYLYSLKIDESNGSSAEEKIEALVTDCIAKLGPTKVNSLTSDSSAIFSSTINPNIHQTYPQVIAHHCLAHFSSELFMDLVKYNQAILDSVRDSYRILLFITARPSLSRKLEAIDRYRYQFGYKSRTSWSSICNYLTVLKTNSSAVCEAIESYMPQSREKDQFEAIKELLNSGQFWQGVDDAQQLLHIMVQLAVSIENDSCRLSDFFAKFLAYGRFIMAREPNTLMVSFLKRFCQLDVSLLQAAYLLDPRYNGAYIRDEGIKLAIERILTIASEQGDFDEDDGKVLYEYWELFLKRQEPFNVGQRSDPVEWWMSIRSCPQSIQAIATRILRLRTSPANAKRLLSSQRYQDGHCEMSNDSTVAEDLGVLRYAYELDDGHSNQGFKETNVTAPDTTNGEPQSSGDVPEEEGSLSLVAMTSCDFGLELLDINAAPTMDNHRTSHTMPSHMLSTTMINEDEMVNLEEMVEYRTFLAYIDFNYEGVSLPKVFVQKKKWTAQDVLSKLELVYG